MRYTTDDMRNWAKGAPDLGLGGVSCAMREAADEIDRLREALKKVAIISHHRMAEGGGTVPSGFSCEICEAECDGALTTLRHTDDCPLSILNPK